MTSATTTTTAVSTSSATAPLVAFTAGPATLPTTLLTAQVKQQAVQSLSNTFISTMGWQLLANTDSTFTSWLKTNYTANQAKNLMWDGTGTAYYIDGYALVGTITLNSDPTTAGTSPVTSGYMYACAKNGYQGTNFTCAYTIGTAATMATNTNIGTVTSTSGSLSNAASFNTLATGSTTNPAQLVVDPAVSGSIFTKSTCTNNDGTAGCWGQTFAYAANKSVWTVWYYMLKQTDAQSQLNTKTKGQDVQTSYGFRYNPGDSVDFGVIMSLNGAAGNQNHFGAAYVLQGATSTILGASAIVAGVVATMF